MAKKELEQSAPPVKPDAEKPAEGEESPLTMSRAELQKLIDDNRKEAEQGTEAKLANKAAKEKETADAKALEEQGKWQERAEKADARAEAAENREKELLRAGALRDHLAEKHPDYSTCWKYILGVIPTDVEGDALAKVIETAAADYVKDNPRQAKGSTGLPPSPRTANRQGGEKPNLPVNRNALPNGNRISSPASRF